MGLTRWFWVRHGPTHQTAFTGWRDVPADLSNTGAIARLNAYLPKDAVVISSDLTRAVTTADILQDGRTRLPHASEFREFDFGEWDGRHFSDISETDPDRARAFWEDPGSVTPPGGESWDNVAARATPVVESLTEAHAGGAIIAVAHIGTIMTQIAAASGQTPSEIIVYKIEPLSVTCLTHDSTRGWQVERINHRP